MNDQHLNFEMSLKSYSVISLGEGRERTEKKLRLDQNWSLWLRPHLTWYLRVMWDVKERWQMSHLCARIAECVPSCRSSFHSENTHTEC